MCLFGFDRVLLKRVRRPCFVALLLDHALRQSLLSTSLSAVSYLYLRVSSTLSLPPSPSLSFPAHSCSRGFSSPLPLLLAELQSRWVFSSCYDLRDDNGSYNVASRSWCGWACGGLCCVKVGDSLREGGGDGGGTQLLSQPRDRVYLNFFYYFFLCFLVFSLLTHWLLLAPLLSFSGKLCFQYLAMFL